MEHAFLSASAASRWLVCTPSAHLEKRFEDTKGVYADEGTLAHRLGELLIHKLGWLDGKISSKHFKAELKKIQADDLYDASMFEHAANYATFVIERFNSYPGAMLYLEQRLDLREYVPEGFGTTDAVIAADGIVEIIDLKYGKGVSVSADNNAQMSLYALGVLIKDDWLYNIQTVRLTIYQPRMSNISSFDVAVSDLLHWANNDLRPLAQRAFAGEGKYVPGEHCRFCKAKAVCRAYADYNLHFDFEDDPMLLTDIEVVDILAKSKGFMQWIQAVEEYALKSALGGKKWPGFKLVEGRSSRVIKDEKAVAKLLLKKGIKEADLFIKKMIGITALQKMLGSNFDTYLAGQLLKPPGSPTLVPVTDGRPEMNDAKTDFA